MIGEYRASEIFGTGTIIPVAAKKLMNDLFERVKE